MSDTTISRRSLIGTGTLSALGVGLMSLAPSAGAVQAAAPDRVVVINTDDLAEESRRLLDEYRKETAEQERQYHALRDQLSEPQQRLLRDYADQAVAGHFAGEAARLAELARHFPAFTSALRLVAEHIAMAPYAWVGACCTVTEGFEP